MRGRKAKPAQLRLVSGARDRRKVKSVEPKPRRVIPSPPGHMSDRALTAWGSVSARLDRMGLLTELDDFALEQLCENYAEILELRADIKANGRVQVVTTKSGDRMERTRPAQAQLQDAERRFRGMMSDFGLSPSARTRVNPTSDDDADSDPAKAYFG